MRLQYQQSVANQLWEFYPPEGKPDASPAPTFGLYRGTTALISPTAITQDTVSTTITATAGAQTVTLGSSTGVVVGRRYWVQTATGGKGYEVDVVDVPDATSAILAQPVKEAVTAGLFKGHGQRRTFSAAELTSLYDGLRVEVVYYVASVRYAKRQHLDIVRVPLTLASLDIGESEIEKAYPDFGRFVDVEGKWRGIVETAFGEVQAELLDHTGPNEIDDSEGIKRATVFAALSLFLIDDARTSAAFQARAENEIRRLLGNTKLRVSTDGYRTIQVGTDTLLQEVDTGAIVDLSDLLPAGQVAKIG